MPLGLLGQFPLDFLIKSLMKINENVLGAPRAASLSFLIKSLMAINENARGAPGAVSLRFPY